MTERRRLLLAFLAFMALGMPAAAVGVAWPSIADELGRTLGDLGTVAVAGAIGYGAGTLLADRTIRRFGSGPVIAVAAACSVVGITAYLVTGVWWAILTAVAVAGLAGGLLDTGLNGFAALEMSPNAMNMLHAGFGLGAAAGPWLVTAALTVTGSWRVGVVAVIALVLSVAAALAVTVGWWTLTPEPDVEPPQPVRLPRGLVVLAVLVFFFYSGVEISTGQWAFTMLTRARDVGVGAAGFAAGAFFAGLTGSRALLGVVGHRIRLQTVLLASVVATAASLGLVWWTRSPLVAMAGLVVTGFALGPVFPLHTTLAPRRFGRRAAPRVIGYQIFAANLGVAVVPWLIGRRVDASGAGAIAPLLFAGAVALLAVDLLLRRRDRGSTASAVAVDRLPTTPAGDEGAQP